MCLFEGGLTANVKLYFCFTLQVRCLSVGDSASMVKTFTEEEVEMFAEISGDRNPIHFDHDYAAGTRYERPIVHGVLTVGLLSAVMGMQCPGPGTICTLNIYHLDTELLMTRLSVGISHNKISENIKIGIYATFSISVQPSESTS